MTVRSLRCLAMPLAVLITAPVLARGQVASEPAEKTAIRSFIRREPPFDIRTASGGGPAPVVLRSLDNPFNRILRLSAYLNLSSAQEDTIASLDHQLRKARRTPQEWMNELRPLPRDASVDSVWAIVLAAYDDAIHEVNLLTPHLKGVLSAEQRARLPSDVAAYLNPACVVRLKPMSAAATGIAAAVQSANERIAGCPW